MYNCQTLSSSLPPNIAYTKYPSYATFIWSSRTHYTNPYRKMHSCNLLDFCNQSVCYQCKFWLAKFIMRVTDHSDMWRNDWPITWNLRLKI